ncbi:MAG: VanZ family protein [Sphaerochaeta sp.]|nr:VanZ family protein [Sphaerochaeta sp.]MCH3919008.1 VanZ family protein [Sphaerochaeta sp.]MCI2044914.1 VanZ family protein [Sphaerochaeta sp.]MCI2075779.1 VanZ family protein [Sphaerochaeta sp.]MCI2096448.1 VanZ family protein [Sphaerochaeta sp.]
MDKVVRSVGIGLTVIVVLLIILFSLEDSSSVPSISWIPFADKGSHAVAYCALGFSIGMWRTRGWKGFAVSLVCVVAFGVLLELVQPQFGRYLELADVAADAIGGATGLGLMAAVRRLFLHF